MQPAWIGQVLIRKIDQRVKSELAFTSPDFFKSQLTFKTFTSPDFFNFFWMKAQGYIGCTVGLQEDGIWEKLILDPQDFDWFRLLAILQRSRLTLADVSLFPKSQLRYKCWDTPPLFTLEKKTQLWQSQTRVKNKYFAFAFDLDSIWFRQYLYQYLNLRRVGLLVLSTCLLGLYVHCTTHQYYTIHPKGRWVEQIFGVTLTKTAQNILTAGGDRLLPKIVDCPSNWGRDWDWARFSRNICASNVALPCQCIWWSTIFWNKKKVVFLVRGSIISLFWCRLSNY